LKVKLNEDLTIHYEKAGSGEKTILFVPGWSMSTAVFEKQLTAFEGSSEYTFVTYDPRGQGLSSKTEGGHFYQQHARGRFKGHPLDISRQAPVGILSQVNGPSKTSCV